MSGVIAEIVVDVMSQDGTRQAKQGNRCHKPFHFPTPGPFIVPCSIARCYMFTGDADCRRSKRKGCWRTALASIASLSSFLSDKLLLRKLGETVIVVGNAPYDRPRFFVGHLVGNRASFFCTKSPLCMVPGELSDH